MKKTTLFIIFLAILAGVLGFYFFQKNIYSKDILKVEILGPEEADLLQEIEYIVKYKNNGNTRLEEPQLIFEYPDYSIPVGEESVRVTKDSDDFGGAIYPGEEKTFSFKARLLGKEGEIKTAKASLRYRPKNLKAGYESSTTFTTKINKVPLTFEFDIPSKIESGKELTFRLNYFSNIDYPLSNLRVMINYPSDFEFINSNPKSLEKTEWKIGLLNKAEGGRIEITGKISGEVSEEKVFQARIGSWQDGEFILLKEATKGIEIVRPDLHISQQINNNPEYVTSLGDLLHYEIFFKNIGETTLTDMFLICRLEGEAFDFQTIKSDRGDFVSGDNSIIFDWRRVPALQFLDAREEGKVEFWIELKEDWEISSAEDKNPVIKNKVYLSQAREEFVNKVKSKIEIVQQGYFQEEVFGNSGPIPPEVGKTTTYTIIWQAKNYYSEVKNTKVKAVLSAEVKLTGQIFPEEESEKFAFDSQSRELVWEVGDLEVGQGILNDAPNISFQIEFTPKESQKGRTPDLISVATISGQDQWTENTLTASSTAIDTTLPDDDTVTNSQGVVQ